MKILAILPTIYPEKMNKMTKSMDLTKSKHTDFIFSSQGTVTEAINMIFNENKDYDFYFTINDDIEFMTPLWDIALAKKGKITYGTDKVDIGINGNFLMIDGDIARATGWLQLPTLNKYCGDTVWKFIGEQLDILEYVPEVVIQHNWVGANKEENDRDMGKFAEWLPWAFKDCNKIRSILNDK